MKLKALEARVKSEKGFSKEEAKSALIRLLQDAHAGERAAAYAYYGHAKSLFVSDQKEKKEIFEIYEDEIHHRAGLYEMLKGLGAKPRFLREKLMQFIGAIIGFSCLFGGWFIPMYGAGKLESNNIEEYEVAARLALLSGNNHLIKDLLDFAEKEWDHELYFRNKSETHFLYRFFPKWTFPDKKENIRKNYEEFVS